MVLVEQAGRVAALGVVLNGDGRILTALSRVTPGQLFVRYANGTLETARIGHSDPARDPRHGSRLHGAHERRKRALTG